MPLDASLIGKEYPPLPEYRVSREKIREFAIAIGEHSPACHDVAAAQALGHRDLVAPPTFAFTLTMKAMAAAMFDPELGMNYALVVHGEQRFHYDRPIVAGDLLSVRTRIADIATRGANEILTMQSAISDAGGEVVAHTNEVIVSRGTAAVAR